VPLADAKPSPYSKLQQANVELQEELNVAKRKVVDGGLFDLRKGTPENIARTIVDTVSVSRAEALHKAIGMALKVKKNQARQAG